MQHHQVMTSYEGGPNCLSDTFGFLKDKHNTIYDMQQIPFLTVLVLGCRHKNVSIAFGIDCTHSNLGTAVLCGRDSHIHPQ